MKYYKKNTFLLLINEDLKRFRRKHVCHVKLFLLFIFKSNHVHMLEQGGGGGGVNLIEF